MAKKTKKNPNRRNTTHLLIHARPLALVFVAVGGTIISSYGMQYNAKHPANACHRYNEVLETCLIKAQDVTFIERRANGTAPTKSLESVFHHRQNRPKEAIRQCVSFYYYFIIEKHVRVWRGEVVRPLASLHCSGVLPDQKIPRQSITGGNEDFLTQSVVDCVKPRR